MAQVYSIYSSRGYTVFGVRPGSRTRYTALEMADHVKTAIRYVKQHASEYKIDPDRIGLTGASAGGHLATLVALTPEDASPDSRNPLLRHDTRLKAAAVFFPPTDFLDWDGKPASTALLGDLMFLGGVKGHSEEEIKERAAQISPARQVKATPIPFLLIHGDADPLVPLQQSQKMLEVLKMAGGSAELIVKKGGGHPWMTIPEEVKIMADWFDRQLTAAQAATLVIDEIEMAKTPQAATWFFCFEADIDGVKARHYRENKGYDKNQLTIPLSLELAKVKPGQKCSFRVQLDDVDDDACGDEPDNRSTGEFTVSERGSQSYKPEDEWRYTLRWHLK